MVVGGLISFLAELWWSERLAVPEELLLLLLLLPLLQPIPEVLLDQNAPYMHCCALGVVTRKAGNSSSGLTEGYMANAKKKNSRNWNNHRYSVHFSIILKP